MVSKAEFYKIEKGDRIEFKVATRSHCRKAIRKVKKVERQHGWVEVGYHGWPDFAVKAHEILRVIKQEKTQ